MPKAVVTRFAPSPTGFLHIGGARTALFNWLFARGHNGTFLLRIEDTDRARSTPEATQAILDGLAWLGLDHDGDVISQFERADRHAEVARQLLAEGKAYKCFATQDEIAAFREAARAEGKSTLYRSPWRDADPATHPDTPYVVRIKAPQGGQTVIRDQVQGDVTIRNDQLDDMVLLRGDGTPVYMLAVVVDDHDMGVTHVIRGDDHLRNAFRQIPIYQAMGWDVPEFAHVPLIHGPDGKKLSKRHGAQSTLEYRDMGYLPEAVTSYLMKLGWSHGDQDIFTLAEAAEVFDTSGIGKAPARLDFDKLADVNRHYMRQADPARLMALVLPWLEKDGALGNSLRSAVQQSLPSVVERASTLPELAEAVAFITTPRPLPLNKNARKALKGEGLDRLSGLRDLISSVSEFDTPHLQDAIQAYCTAQDLGMGKVGPPLRAALTGGLPAPDLAPVMEWLGREETLARIDDQLAVLRDDI